MYNTVIHKITIHTLINTYSPYITKGLQNTRSAQNKRATTTTGKSNILISCPGGVYPHLHLYLLTPFNKDDHCINRRHKEHTIDKKGKLTWTKSNSCNCYTKVENIIYHTIYQNHPINHNHNTTHHSRLDIRIM